MNRWSRIGRKPIVRYVLVGTDWWVTHCGHPTALWPYYGVSPNGTMLLAPNGRGFRHLREAKAAVEKASSEGVT